MPTYTIDQYADFNGWAGIGWYVQDGEAGPMIDPVMMRCCGQCVSLPERDKGRRLEKRFAKMVRKRHEAQFQESQRFMAELEARGM